MEAETAPATHGIPFVKLMDEYRHAIHDAREHLVTATITESTRDYPASRAALERADCCLRLAKAKSLILLAKLL